MKWKISAEQNRCHTQHVGRGTIKTNERHLVHKSTLCNTYRSSARNMAEAFWLASSPCGLSPQFSIKYKVGYLWCLWGFLQVLKTFPASEDPAAYHFVLTSQLRRTERGVGKSQITHFAWNLRKLLADTVTWRTSIKRVSGTQNHDQLLLSSTNIHTDANLQVTRINSLIVKGQLSLYIKSSHLNLFMP